MEVLMPPTSIYSKDEKVVVTETASDYGTTTSATADAAPTLQVPPESYSYFTHCSVPSPLAYATDAIASLSACLSSNRRSMACNADWLSPAGLGFNSDRHHHQQQKQQQQQVHAAYSNNAAMSWPSDRKPYTHTPTHAASSFLTTSTAHHMTGGQQDAARKG